MKKLLVIFLLSTYTFLNAQNTTIGYGEKLVFTASYNMSGILTDIAQVKMETSKVSTSSNTLMRLKCTANTYSNFDSFFKIRDLYESYVSPKSLTPYLYKRDISEGGYYKFMQYKYRYKSKKVESLMKKRRGDGIIWEVNKTLPLTSGARDLVSTLYTLRNVDIHKANIGDASSFKVLMDNEVATVNFKLIGKETLSTAIGRKECYKIAISIRGKDFLKGNNANVLWLTADGNKVPVKAIFKIAVGNGELRLKSASGLKN